MKNAQTSQFQTSAELDQIFLVDEKQCAFYISKDHSMQPHVRAAISRHRNLSPDTVWETSHVSMEHIAKLRSEGAGEPSDVKRTESEMQRVATELFRKAVLHKTSDIHIRVGFKSSTRVLFRVNNDLKQIESHPASWGTSLCQAIYHSMADVADPTLDVGRRQDARIGDKSHLGVELDGIRVATTPMVDGFVMVLRLLYDASGATDDLVDLGFTEDQCERVQFLKKRPTGITLITGPTGSGKSTTLQRVLTSLIRETAGTKHVITVEDPPEYPIAGAVQTPVTNTENESDRSEAFQEAIKGAMRVDPDVMMIGEIRDAPSARLSMQAAMTGHQVWTTLHSNGAFPSIERLVDLGIPLTMLCDPSILNGLVSQRLLKSLCSCKKPMRSVMGELKITRPSFDEDLKRFQKIASIDEMFVTGDGCEKCRNSGVAGRTVVAEVVVLDQTMLNHIRNKNVSAAIEHWKKNQAGMSMVEHAALKIKQGQVDPFSAESTVGDIDGGLSRIAELSKHQAAA